MNKQLLKTQALFNNSASTLEIDSKSLHRGYYMAAWRYEISLRVFKNISRVSTANKWNIFNTQREISYLQAAM